MNAEFVEPVTPASSYDKINNWNNEDSGYHTSFTPGSVERSELSIENLDPKAFFKRKASDIHNSGSPKRKYARLKSNTTYKDSFTISSPERRGKKRPFIEHDSLDNSVNSIPTPTSFIAGGIQRLKVNEACDFYGFEESSNVLSYPTTPVKKICRSNISILSPNSYNCSYKSSPLRTVNNTPSLAKRSAKKLNFNSLQKEDSTDQSICRNEKLRKKPCKAIKSIFRPEQKIDIIKMLYHKIHCVPAISKILSYLDNKEIYNFSLVSPIWLQVCEEVAAAKSKREEYVKYIRNTKENSECRDKEKSSTITSMTNEKSTSSLRDIHNIISVHHIHSPKRSPPGTPRTMRFRRFIKVQ